MLQFFRKYKQFFFVLITAVIVITFSFFGVAPSPAGSMVNTRDDVLAYTNGGHALTRGDLEDMILFLNTDSKNSRSTERAWGFNFLNDGVIRKDFVETGLANILMKHYRSVIGPELQERFVREKRYRTYRHPQAPFVNTETVWNYFAPNLKAAFDALRKENDASSDSAIDARTKLYLEQGEFPSLALKQALIFQQQQYEWIQPDPQLRQADLSLFTYHTASDWFGKKFMHLVAQFIFNAAEVADSMGYDVSDDEVRASLLNQSQSAFDERFSQDKARIPNAAVLYQEQLRRMNMGEGRALATWRQVMLCRRLFDEIGNAALVDSLVYKKFNDYATEALSAEVFELPPALRLRRFSDLQRFEVYRLAVAEDKGLDQLPTNFFSAEQIKARYPELVQKRYSIRVRSIDKETLQTKIGVRETWDWQVTDEGWGSITQEFRELALHGSKTEEERFAILQELDGKTRLQVDAFSREKIVETHPEWLEEAFLAAKGRNQLLQLRLAGGKLSLKGVKDRSELMQLLDEAELNGEPSGKLALFSQDDRNYHEIQVLERSKSLEVLTFAEAKQNGILDEVLERQLEAHYTSIRDNQPLTYKGKNGEWRPLAEVREEVARDYFATTVEGVNTHYHQWRSLQPAKKHERDHQKHSSEEDRAASRRFVQLQLKALEQLSRGEGHEELVANAQDDTVDEGELPPRATLEDQWKLIQRTHTILRNGEELIDTDEAFALKPGAWSVLHTNSIGNVFFYQAGEPVEYDASVVQLMDRGRDLLSMETKRNFFEQMIQKFEEEEALNISYLTTEEEV